MTVPDLRRAGQIDGSFIVYAAAIRITSHRRAARNTAAGHGERAFFSHEHTAAPRLKGGGGRTAHDIAAVHGERTAALHVHAAAVNRCPDAACAAVDDTAADGLGAVLLIQHPQAVSVGGELMLRIRPAVFDGQVYAVFHLNAGHFQHIAVQVDGKVGAHRHGPAVVNVVQQLETAADVQRFINVAGHRCLSGGARRHRRRGHRQLRLSLYKFPHRLLRLPRLLLLLRVAGLFALPGLFLLRLAGLFALPGLLRLFDLRYRLPHGCVLRQCLHRQQRQRHDQSHQYAYDTSFHSPLLFLLTSPRSPARTSWERIFATWHVYHHYAIQC